MKIGKLTIISENGKDKNGRKLIFCQCDCGNARNFDKSRVMNGRTKSCGCLVKEIKQKASAERFKLGAKFHKLTIIEVIRKTGEDTLLRCLCDCGNETVTKLEYVSCGDTKSCGCVKRSVGGDRTRTHGDSGSPEHRAWKSMIARTRYPDKKRFKDYISRGISVCERWLKYENFLEDMGRKPGSEYSLDRIDNDKGYSPENCRWATRIQQSRNTRRNRKLSFRGQLLTIPEIAEITNIEARKLESYYYNQNKKRQDILNGDDLVVKYLSRKPTAKKGPDNSLAPNRHTVV